MSEYFSRMVIRSRQIAIRAAALVISSFFGVCFLVSVGNAQAIIADHTAVEE